jgi:hypothetical protein
MFKRTIKKVTHPRYGSVHGFKYANRVYPVRSDLVQLGAVVHLEAGERNALSLYKSGLCTSFVATVFPLAEVS